MNHYDVFEETETVVAFGQRWMSTNTVKRISLRVRGMIKNMLVIMRQLHVYIYCNADEMNTK